MRNNLFSGPGNTLTTLFLLGLLAYLLPPPVQWGSRRAVFATPAAACR
jgi:hypothetical protein